MENIKFEKPEVAEKFESVVPDDLTVHKAGVYSGKLSAISMTMAEAMVKQNSNLIKAKDTSPKETAPKETVAKAAGAKETAAQDK